MGWVEDMHVIVWVFFLNFRLFFQEILTISYWNDFAKFGEFLGLDFVSNVIIETDTKKIIDEIQLNCTKTRKIYT